MLRRYFCLMVVLGMALPAFAVQNAESDPRWSQAETLRGEGRFGEAAALFESMLLDFPNSQPLTTMAAICAYEDNDAAQVPEELETAVAISPFSKKWAPMGLYYHVRVCTDYDCGDEAMDALSTLQARFPESIWTARAEGVYQATARDGQTEQPNPILLIEEAAYTEFEQALSLLEEGNADGAIAAMQGTMEAYPETRTALAINESMGYVLIRANRKLQARDHFESLADDLQVQYPDSRIAQDAQLRTANLYSVYSRKAIDGETREETYNRRTADREKAISMLTDLADNSPDSQLAVHALRNAAGLVFEKAKDNIWRLSTRDPQEWIDLREMCQEIVETPHASGVDRARASLMYAESYQWEGNGEMMVEAATEFLGEYDAETYPQETAMAHLVRGEGFFNLREYDWALDDFDWVIAHSAEGPIWPGVDMEVRARYYKYSCLRRSGAEDQVVLAEAETLLTKFPETYYAGLVRISLSRHFPDVEIE